MLFNTDIFPDGGGSHRVRPEKKDLWKVVLSLVLITLLVILYALEIPYFSRVFEIESLIFRGIIVGLIFGGLIGYRLTKSVKDSLDKVKIYLLMVFIGMLVLPIFFMLTNRLLSPYESQVEQVEFIEMKPFAQYGITQTDLQKGVQPTGFYVFFVRNGQIERTRIDTSMYLDNQRGDQIDLSIYKGLWGYDVIETK